MEREPSEFAWDVFCIDCTGEFLNYTQDLVQIKNTLSNWQYRCRLWEIALNFHIAWETVEGFIWQFDDDDDDELNI